MEQNFSHLELKFSINPCERYFKGFNFSSYEPDFIEILKENSFSYSENKSTYLDEIILGTSYLHTVKKGNGGKNITYDFQIFKFDLPSKSFFEKIFENGYSEAYLLKQKFFFDSIFLRTFLEETLSKKLPSDLTTEEIGGILALQNKGLIFEPKDYLYLLKGF